MRTQPTGGAVRGCHRGPTNSVVWAVLRQELDRAGRPLDIVDVGGGTGGYAVPLARAGHKVTVVDASPDALAALTRRVAEDSGPVTSGRIVAVQGNVDALGEVAPPGSADLVLCHSVLKVVDQPGEGAGQVHRGHAAPRRRGERDRREPGGGRAGAGDQRPPRRRARPRSPTRPAAPARPTGCAAATTPGPRARCWPGPA